MFLNSRKRCTIFPFLWSLSVLYVVDKFCSSVPLAACSLPKSLSASYLQSFSLSCLPSSLWAFLASGFAHCPGPAQDGDLAFDPVGSCVFPLRRKRKVPNCNVAKHNCIPTASCRSICHICKKTLFSSEPSLPHTPFLNYLLSWPVFCCWHRHFHSLHHGHLLVYHWPPRPARSWDRLIPQVTECTYFCPSSANRKGFVFLYLFL